MKKTLLFVAMMLCCAMTIFAQNDKISYQAVVRDTENKLVANKSVEVTVNIYNGTATTAAYTETQTVTTNLNGLISLQIGPNGTNASWNSIEWNKARIETTVKLNGTQLGTLAMPLTAVPYAMYAKYADNVDPDALAAQMHDTANNVRGEMNNKLADKANVADVYTKAQTNVNIHDTAEVVRGEMNNKLADKANVADVYTKAQTNVNIHDTAEVVRGEMNNKLADKADAADVYTKQQVYTKAEVDALLQTINETIAGLPKMNQQDSVIAATQTSTETVFTLARTVNTNCIYRMYINGVMVGGSHNGVLVPVTGEGNKVKYDGTKNGGYMLKANDKVTIVYWY